MVTDKYTDILFSDKSSSFDACDCWGLVRLIYGEEYGIMLLDFSDYYENYKDKKSISEIIESQQKEWVKIEHGQQKEGDVVCLNIIGRPWHVGIVIDSQSMIHSSPGNRVVCIERYTSLRWSKRIDGFYRHKQLIANDPA